MAHHSDITPSFVNELFSIPDAVSEPVSTVSMQKLLGEARRAGTFQPTILDTHHLDDHTRLVASYYSAPSYSATYLEDPPPVLGKCTTYHSGDPTERGTNADRKRYLADMQAHAVDVSANDLNMITVYTSKTSAVTREEIKNQQVALGLKYAKSELQYDGQNPTSPFHWCRGYMFKGMNNQDMTISGRWPPASDPESPSTEDHPWIDKHVKNNFVQTSLPRQNFTTDPEGVLVLDQKEVADQHLGSVDDASGQSVDPTRSEGVEDSILPAIWSVPYNDSFYADAVHQQNPIRLASKRTKDNMVADDETGRLTIFGREAAVILGSGSYETHTTNWSEAYVPTGIPKGQEHGVSDWLEAVRKYTDNPQYRNSLSWHSDNGSYLEPGEVVVTSLERRIGDNWISERSLGTLPGV